MAVFGPLPGYARASLRLRDIQPGRSAHQAAALLRQASATAVAEGAELGEQAEDPRIARWRAAYEVVGLPPESLPPHAALLAWAATPGGVPSQGPLLDLVHAIALRYCVPAAAYDLAALEGDLWLRPSRGVEVFEGTEAGGDPEDGGPASFCATINELILVDSLERVHARAWHGEQSAPSRPGSGTREALVHFDLLAGDDEPGTARIQAAALAVELGRLAGAFLGAEAQSRILGREEPQALWEA